MDIFKRLFLSVLGLFIASIGINITYASTIGSAPIEALIHQLAAVFLIKPGTLTIVTAVVLLSISKLLTREKLQFRGIIGGLILGYFINLGDFVDYNSLFDIGFINQLPNLFSSILIALIGGFLMGLGSVITVENKMLMSYNDAFVIQLRNKFFQTTSIGKMKIIYDFSILGIILLLSFFIPLFSIKLGNVILALAIGTNVNWIRSHEKWILHHVKHNIH